MLALRTLEAHEYARAVLPHSAAMWAGRRSPAQYAAEWIAAATSRWGTRRLRAVGLFADGALVASCKRYERALRCGGRSYRAAGIGAVFTPTELRGRGYATALLGAFLDAERAAGTDLAFLFSDIHPAFYERIGFRTLPSRSVAVRAATLPDARIAVTTLGDGDMTAMRHVFDALEARRPFAFRRTALDWEWQRLRASSLVHSAPRLRLGVRRARGLAAYVAGRRMAASDSFLLEEFAFATPDDAGAIAPLLRAAAGDLRRVEGWLPPAVARDAIPAGAVRRRTTSIAMAVALSDAFARAWRLAPPASEAGDVCWSTDHV